MTDLIADLNRIRERACYHVLHGNEPLDPAEVATVCRRAVEALTPPDDVTGLPMNEAPKDLTPVLARIRRDLSDFAPHYGMAGPANYAGLFVVVRHPGLPEEDSFDIGWSLAGPFGHGLGTDEYFEGWWPLPPAQSAALAQVTRERDEALAQVDACTEYLKPGETPAERIKREHDDCCSLMEMLAKDRERRDAAEAQVSALKAENERLRAALDGLVECGCEAETEYDGRTMIFCHYCGVDLGENDDHTAACDYRVAVEARAALTPGRGADESGEAGDA